MTNLKNPDAVQQRAARVLASRSKRRTESAETNSEDPEMRSPRASRVGSEVGRGIPLPWSQGLKYHFFLSQ